jgi:flavin-dependent dehydrogenase
MALAMAIPAGLEQTAVTTVYDALVIGGGPAGSATALLLARADWSVALVERKEFPRRKVCGEYLSATNLPLLDHLGVGAAFRDLAGPPVRRVGLFAGRALLSADLPRPGGTHAEWGRALSREHLDMMLLDEARRAGAEIHQPFTVTSLRHDGDLRCCEARSSDGEQSLTLTARVVVAAHGSWEAGTLPTQPVRLPPAPSDLLGFKAHFITADLPAGLMPLLAFPGGYGGMVHCDGGRISLSCCVRRDQLDQVRAQCPGGAGEAVQAHIEASCLGAAKVLDAAQRDGPWLAAGPIRPGIRLHCRGGIFPVGNAAGEAHPVIAEGISIALQSAWLLARGLIAWRRDGAARDRLAAVAATYTDAWRKRFAGRLHASQAIAHWAMHPGLVAATVPLLRCFPALLNWSSRLSGKASRMVPK